MSSFESIPLVDQVSWSNQGGTTDIRDIVGLGIDETTLSYATQGHLVETQAADGIRTLASQGFGKCAALILRDSVEGGWGLAHAQPFDERLYCEVRDQTKPVDEALFVFGSVSVHQGDLDELLTKRGIPVRSLRVETGSAHWGIALDVPSSKLTVVRKTPDQSLMGYEPFEAK